ncbi:PilZ domain-containing protein [Marinobacteraceae bacterium S3BR75-40.1]
MVERRRRKRLPWVAMHAQVKIKKNMLSSEWVEVEVIDYNSLGIGIRSELELDSDRRIQLSLRLETEVGDISVERINGVIRHSHMEEKGRFFGIEFDEKSKEATRESLQRIEGIVEKYQQLTRRMETPS